MKNNNNNSESVQTAPEQQSNQKSNKKKHEIDYFLRNWTIPKVLINKEEDYTLSYPNNKFCFGKYRDYKYADYTIYVAKVGEKIDDDTNKVGKVIWEKDISDYAESIGDLLWNGKKIINKIIADVNEFIKTNYPELLEYKVVEEEVA